MKASERASAIAALGRERPWVSGVSWLSGRAESGLPVYREPTSNDGVDSDQGGHPTSSSCTSTRMGVHMHRKSPSTPTYAFKYVRRHDTHIYTHAEEGNRFLKKIKRFVQFRPLGSCSIRCLWVGTERRDLLYVPVIGFLYTCV